MTDATTEKPSRREEAAAKLARGTWDGTQDLLVEIAEESRYAYGWRPVRAAALMAVRDMAGERNAVVMTAAEWDLWLREAKALAKLRGDGHPRDRIGVTAWQARSFSKDGAPKVVALACAHYLMGLPMPIPAGDPRAFDDWFRPRFGAVDRISQWLQLNREHIAMRLQGFEVIKGERAERLPSAYLIRALDWAFTVGPVCPYGVKAPLALWPGQDLEEDY